MGVLIQDQTFHEKKCAVCEQLFKPNSGQHLYCSPKCKGRVQYINGYGSTENQYKRISYNWRRFLQRLIYKSNRSKLTIEDLLNILEQQNGKCALTGCELTCVLGQGRSNYYTNASIDRIIPGSEYTKENIRLVCRIANIMKWNLQDEEFKEWCRKIIEYNGS